jgi:hypothetical protein
MCLRPLAPVPPASSPCRFASATSIFRSLSSSGPSPPEENISAPPLSGDTPAPTQSSVCTGTHVCTGTQGPCGVIKTFKLLQPKTLRASSRLGMHGGTRDRRLGGGHREVIIQGHTQIIRAMIIRGHTQIIRGLTCCVHPGTQRLAEGRGGRGEVQAMHLAWAWSVLPAQDKVTLTSIER